MDLSSLKKYLRNNRKVDEKEIDENPTKNILNEMAKDDIKDPEKNVIFLDSKNIWITNDGLLRDEGVLFGLTSAITTEKIHAIKNYFIERKAEIQARKESISGNINELINERKKLETELEQLKNPKLEGQQETQKKNTHFFRNLLGFVFITGAAFGNFFLIHYFVTPAFGIAASIGIFLFGLFSLVAPLSTWLNPDDQSDKSILGRVKIALLEVGSPLATTLFVSYIIYDRTQKIGFTIVIAVFLLFLFFFCGKLLLGVYHHLVEDYKYLSTVRNDKKLSKQRIAQDNNGIEKKTIILEEKTKTINTLQAEALKLEAECLSLDQQSELKVNLFMSEYNLAKNYSANPNI